MLAQASMGWYYSVLTPWSTCWLTGSTMRKCSAGFSRSFSSRFAFSSRLASRSTRMKA